MTRASVVISAHNGSTSIARTLTALRDGLEDVDLDADTEGDAPNFGEQPQRARIRRRFPADNVPVVPIRCDAST